MLYVYNTPPLRFLTLAIFLSMPLHLYWGRSFLIETMGLFLSLSMVACIFAGYRHKNWRWLAAGLAFGILAALCKITTWAVACGVAGLLVLFSEGLPKRQNLAWLLLAGAVAVLPIVPGKLWLVHGDSVKAENPFASQMINSSSAKQAAWNFGTWEQKTNPAVWEHIGHHVGDQLAAPVPFFGHWLVPLILIAGVLANPKRLPLLLIFLVGFAAGPLIFTNLYFEHNYYWVANGTWLVLALGVALASISEFRPKEVWPQYTVAALCAVLCIAGFAAWHSKFLPILQNIPDRNRLAEVWTNPIQQAVPVGKIMLILSLNWNPNALYYAQRKGIAFPTGDGFSFDGKELQESLAALAPDEKLGGVVINNDFLAEPNKAFFSNLLQVLGMETSGSQTPFGVLFPARKSNEHPR